MPKWWENGVRFECQGSGRCCTSRGEYGYVYLTLKDRQRMAKHLGLSTRKFTSQYCDKSQGHFYLKESDRSADCRFLKDKRCTIYESRPTQCRTWPFWPELMNAKAWSRQVAGFCPGVGKGTLVSKEKITAQLNLQQQADLSD